MEQTPSINQLFNQFTSATSMELILSAYRSISDELDLKATQIGDFYPKLRSKVQAWKAQELWKILDTRVNQKVYENGSACRQTKVLVIGAGPCGLRTAIEMQLLGARVVVIEKRSEFTRNNVLHLWPFIIADLNALGIKKFYGKFCAGTINHVSIQQLQCVLLKIALLLGVEFHEGVLFMEIIQPTDEFGWRAKTIPESDLSHYDFDVLIGADGKHNTLEGFQRKELRARLAIAITANFVNNKTLADIQAAEISGVSAIYKPRFFTEMCEKTAIDLENIVYYKDETHYFVMTAKKQSLIDKGVIIKNSVDPRELLAPDNINKDLLLKYAREAAEFSTKMQNLCFSVNQHGAPDVAIFDFTSMFAAKWSCCARIKSNHRLLQCLVGDSLLEPFWPTGSGCARGFLSSMDAAYAVKLWSNKRNSILAVLAQRESIYRLLAQTKSDNLHRDINAYTIDPATRYPNLNLSAVEPQHVKHLLKTDDQAVVGQIFSDSSDSHHVPAIVSRKRRSIEINTDLAVKRSKYDSEIISNDEAATLKSIGNIGCSKPKPLTCRNELERVVHTIEAVKVINDSDITAKNLPSTTGIQPNMQQSEKQPLVKPSETKPSKKGKNDRKTKKQTEETVKGTQRKGLTKDQLSEEPAVRRVQPDRKCKRKAEATSLFR